MKKAIFLFLLLFASMIPGTDVVHSKVLVLIYPKSEENKVSTLINIVKDW